MELSVLESNNPETIARAEKTQSTFAHFQPYSKLSETLESTISSAITSSQQQCSK